MSNQKKSATDKIETNATVRFTQEQLANMNDIFPGFAEWYQANYDEQGRYVGKDVEELNGIEDWT